MLTPESGSFIPDISIESQAVRLPEKEALPFEAFTGYDDSVSDNGSQKFPRLQKPLVL